MVECHALLKAVSLLAACAEINQNWQIGMRHDLALVLSGLARKQGLRITLVSRITEEISRISDNPEKLDRLNIALTTFSDPINNLIGYKGLVECLGQTTAKCCLL